MWKPIGVISTLLLAAFSLSDLGIAAWYYDKFNFNDYHKNVYYDLTDYVNSLRAVLACDLMVFVVCFLGLFFIIKPNAGAAKFYCILIVLLVVFKIIVGAIFYSGANDDGKTFNSIWQAAWDYCANYSSCTPNDQMKSWHTARGYEIASIILFAVLGLLSACGVLKVSNNNS